MLKLKYPIESERLVLRPFREDDAEAVHSYQSLPEVAEYQFWEPRTAKEVADGVREWTQMSQPRGKGGIALAIVLKDTGNLIGDVILDITDVEARQASIGYTFHPEFQGRGYATEAARKLLQLGFETLDMHRIFARCDALNEPSWRLMERLGMRREAHFREHALFKGRWDEEFYYAILQREWRHPGQLPR